MQEKRKALGRGLEQLFNSEAFNMQDFEKNVKKSATEEDIIEINIDELRGNPYQPRKIFDDDKLEELASSIKDFGVIEPIIVKKSIKGYEIVAGERRTLASKKAGLKTIPAIVREFSDDDMMTIALLENIQREDLNVIEEAAAYKKMIDTLKITQEELAKKVGKSRSHITNLLGILKLPKKVQDLVLNDKISMGHARSLSKLDDEMQIFEMAEKIIDNNLNVRQVEEMLSNDNYTKKSPIKKSVEKNETHAQIQNIMREKIGTLVKVNNNKVVIPFDSDKDLERILEILNIKIDLD